MKQSIQLRLGQSLVMTPQLQQAIRLLQLSTAELNLEVQEALESNMMLELDEEQDAGRGTGAQNGDGESGAAARDAEPEVDLKALDQGLGGDIPEELPVDSAWDEVYDAPIGASGGSPENAIEIENQRSAEESLREHLLWQINLAPITETDQVIAYAVVDALDSDGFLGASLDDIRETLANETEPGIEIDEIEAMLHWVQSLDPPGVAARDLRECLALQLHQSDPDRPRIKEAKLLISKYFDLLVARDYNQLARRMKLDKEDLQEVIRVIQSLNPRPAAHLESARVEYVVPDVYVRRKAGAWQVELNPEAVPHLRVNPFYAGMVRRADTSADNASLRAHLQEARWFIKSLQSRSHTLLRVATAIVERQRAFLEHGDVAMKPLVLHDIAEVLGMHESTISRVTTRKYMHTPRGIYELKYFFSSHLNTDTGGACSSTAIRAVIKKLIAAEDPQVPMSDSKIAGVLTEQGIQVARRTVAKYREAMAIPPSNERKRLV